MLASYETMIRIHKNSHKNKRDKYKWLKNTIFVSADNGFIYQVIKYTNGFVETIVWPKIVLCQNTCNGHKIKRQIN